MSEQQEPLEADDRVTLRGWLRDLTYREVHLMVEGLWDGFRRVDPRFRKEVQGVVVGDSWYYKALFVIGYIVKVLLLIAIANTVGVGFA